MDHATCTRLAQVAGQPVRLVMATARIDGGSGEIPACWPAERL
jgi:hypothetical protein